MAETEEPESSAVAESGPNRWLPVFVLGIAAVVGAFIGLGFAAYNAWGPGGSTTSASVSTPSHGSATAGATAGQRVELSYSGTAPAGLDDASLAAAPAGKDGDIAFGSGQGATSLTYRYWVPVASVGEGVSALTKAQLDGLVSGATSDWTTVNGVAGKVTFVAAGSPAELAVVAGFTNNAKPAQTFATWDALRAAMTVSSGMIAFVPLDEVRLSTGAVAIDGVDLVRGTGDAKAWPFVEQASVRGVSKKGKQALPALVETLTAKLPKVTHVVATGDILMSRCSLTAIEATGDWAAALRGPVGDYLKGADLALGSLDGSIRSVRTPFGCEEMTNLSSPPQVMAALTYAGIDEVTVATNHIFDCGTIGYCGAQAFEQTLKNLHHAGIKTVGGGMNIDEAHQPAIFDVNGIKVGVLGYDDISADELGATATSPGTAGMDDSYADELAAPPQEPSFYKPASMLQTTRLEADIKALKKQVDVVIVQVQTGFEDTHDASPRSIKALRAAADAGADLVVGNQGHSVQPIEIRGNAFIDYALGNFIFDQVHTVDETQGFLLEADFWGKTLANVRMIPYQIQNLYKPEFADPATSAKIFTDIAHGTADLPAPDVVPTQ